MFADSDVPWLVEQVKQLRAERDLWRDIVDGFFKIAGVADASKGDPWKVSETGTCIRQLRRERDSLNAEIGATLNRLQDAHADRDALQARVERLEGALEEGLAMLRVAVRVGAEGIEGFDVESHHGISRLRAALSRPEPEGGGM